MLKIKPFQAIIMLVAIVLSAEWSIMYFIDAAHVRLLLDSGSINSLDAVFLTLIAAAAAYWLLVLPLRKSMQRNSQLASAIAQTSMGYLSYDPYQSGGAFVFVNEAFKSQTGFEQDDVEGKTFRDFFDGDALEAIARALEGENKLSLEVHFPCKDGSTFWAELKLVPIFEENGLLNQYVVLIHDATDERQSGINTRKMLRAIEQSGESVIITDIHGIIEYVNP
ncbi:MAG: PAS domain S-box protein, partial [Mariprofundaceae bacterium]